MGTIRTAAPGGFDPSASCLRHNGRTGAARLVRVLGGALAVALTLTLGWATPAAAGGAFLAASRSVPAPMGFAGLCARYDWACAQGGPAAAVAADAMETDALLHLAARVTRAVNRGTREISDERQYGRPDHWALPTARGGDCEDFALLKKRELLARGVPGRRLLIATALTRAGVPHAVLVLRTDRGDFVLDNLTDALRPWARSGHTYLRMQDPDAPDRWRLVYEAGPAAGA